MGDEKKTLNKVKTDPAELICDVLLDQQMFSGVVNIIKNEILCITRIHPESKAGNITAPKIKALIKEAVSYSFDFLKWKKAMSSHCFYFENYQEIDKRIRTFPELYLRQFLFDRL